MPPTRSARALKTAILGAVLAAAPGCQHPSRRPYSSARPVYTPAPTAIRPLRIGGYAGSNYGPDRPIEPVVPVDEFEVGRDR